MGILVGGTDDKVADLITEEGGGAPPVADREGHTPNVTVNTKLGEYHNNVKLVVYYSSSPRHKLVQLTSC